MTPLYCPQCRSGLVRVPVQGREREQCPACGHTVFHNPAPVVLALVEHEGHLVLIRRGLDPLAGYWTPPGGYVETGESVEDAVIREAREETGLDVAVDGLVGVYSRADVRVVLAAYRAHSTGGVPLAGDDAAGICLVAPGQLPVQPPPRTGMPIDEWFWGVIEEVTAPWRWERQPRARVAQR